MYGTSLDRKNGTCRRLSENAKSYSTATRPWTVHFAVSSGGYDLWQVDHGALSPDVHVLPPVGSTPTSQDERGTIFGTSTRMRMGDPMKVLAADQEKARMTRWLKQRMKGGTIFGKSTRMRSRNPLGFPEDPRKVLGANQAKARKQRMKGGNVFSKLKKRIQIDFPHRPFPSAHPIHDWYRMRKGIKRGRR